MLVGLSELSVPIVILLAFTSIWISLLDKVRKSSKELYSVLANDISDLDTCLGSILEFLTRRVVELSASVEGSVLYGEIKHLLETLLSFNNPSSLTNVALIHYILNTYMREVRDRSRYIMHVMIIGLVVVTAEVLTLLITFILGYPHTQIMNITIVSTGITIVAMIIVLMYTYIRGSEVENNVNALKDIASTICRTYSTMK